jgi:polysaccharide deacetylase family protein (PEP-CTERM system associated)
LGWIAERLPHLILEIFKRGHEVAAHGYNHDLPTKMSYDELRQDLSRCKHKLENIIGEPIVGFRSPSFAVSEGILKIIQERGFRYDSSYNSFSLHNRYGKISINGSNKLGIAYKLLDNFFELPISNLKINEKTLPWGGGFYFRISPFFLFRYGVKSILKKDSAYIFYLHPWEIDPCQPKIHFASFSSKFKHYVNLSRAEQKLNRLIKHFSHCSFVTCSEYLTLETDPAFQNQPFHCGLSN